MNPVKTFKRIVVGGVQAVAVVSLLAACTDTLEDPRAVDAEPYAEDPGLVIDPPLGGDAPDDTIADAGLGDASTGTDAGATGEHDAGTPGSGSDADSGDGEDC